MGEYILMFLILIEMNTLAVINPIQSIQLNQKSYLQNYDLNQHQASVNFLSILFFLIGMKVMTFQFLCCVQRKIQ